MTRNETIEKVYQRFLESDIKQQGWSELDEQMYALECLSDNQLTIEASVKLNEHLSGNPRCSQDHAIEQCFVPVIVDAVTIILDNYMESGDLSVNNRFVLEYYLSVSQIGLIVY